MDGLTACCACSTALINAATSMLAAFAAREHNKQQRRDDSASSRQRPSQSHGAQTECCRDDSRTLLWYSLCMARSLWLTGAVPWQPARS